jgi:hypothetical protein
MARQTNFIRRQEYADEWTSSLRYMLPLLAQLRPPLSLLEVSTGCWTVLFPDRYAYNLAAIECRPARSDPYQRQPFCGANPSAVA